MHGPVRQIAADGFRRAAAPNGSGFPQLEGSKYPPVSSVRSALGSALVDAGLLSVTAAEGAGSCCADTGTAKAVNAMTAMMRFMISSY